MEGWVLRGSHFPSLNTCCPTMVMPLTSDQGNNSEFNWTPLLFTPLILVFLFYWVLLELCWRLCNTSKWKHRMRDKINSLFTNYKETLTAISPCIFLFVRLIDFPKITRRITWWVNMARWGGAEKGWKESQDWERVEWELRLDLLGLTFDTCTVFISSSSWITSAASSGVTCSVGACREVSSYL